jgi:hypothetical protein
MFEEFQNKNGTDYLIKKKNSEQFTEAEKDLFREFENERDVSHEWTIEEVEWEIILDFCKNAEDFILSRIELK